MRIVIDLPEEKWQSVLDGTWCGSAEIAEGTPLTEVFEDIRAEIEQEPYVSKMEVLDIIDRHISGEGSDKE